MPNITEWSELLPEPDRSLLPRYSEPTLFTRAAQHEFCELLRAGYGFTAASAMIGVSSLIIRRAMQDHPDVKSEIEEAVAVSVDSIEKSLYDLASQGCLPAIKFLLTNRRPDDWADYRPGLSVGGGAAPISINIAQVARQIAENPAASSLVAEATRLISGTSGPSGLSGPSTYGMPVIDVKVNVTD